MFSKVGDLAERTGTSSSSTWRLIRRGRDVAAAAAASWSTANLGTEPTSVPYGSISHGELHILYISKLNEEYFPSGLVTAAPVLAPVFTAGRRWQCRAAPLRGCFLTSTFTIQNTTGKRRTSSRALLNLPHPHLPSLPAESVR